MNTPEEFNQFADRSLMEYKPSEEMKTYSFRAEYVPDAVKFLNNVLTYISGRELYFTSLLIVTDPRLQEPIVQFQSKISLEELREILRNIEDSHVMLQTLRPIPLSQNKCDRDWSVE